MVDLKEESCSRCFSGYQKVYSHFSQETQCAMKFGIYLPSFLFEPNNIEKAPVLYFLSGLTCTHENFMVKSGFQRYANEYKLIVVNSDTSPRNCGIEGEEDDWDFGTGAAFYVDATTDKFKKHYRMYSYIKELISLIDQHFDKFIIKDCRAITGHSMGGHGALTFSIKNPHLFKCVTAFAPISNASKSLFAIKCFKGYLGEQNLKAWEENDATCLVKTYKGPDLHFRIDQGTEDIYLESDLQPDHFVEACKHANINVDYKLHEGYDHGYFFVATFIPDNFSYIAKYLYNQKN